MENLQSATLSFEATPRADGVSLADLPTNFDVNLSAVAWVHGELRRSLEAAHKAMRRFVKEADAMAGSDVDAPDPAVLRTARQQMHQGVGALEMVGLSAAATLLRACETLLQRAVAKPQVLTATVVDHVEHASFALLDYLSRMLAGKSVSALSLFPQYQAVQDAAGASRVHPADLWMLDWQWQTVPDDALAIPAQPDADAISLVERRLLGLMRGGSFSITQSLSDLCAGLGAGANQSGPSAPANQHASTLWKLASAVFEAQSLGLLKADLFSKRVASRLLAQLRIIERAHTEGSTADVSERLAQDLLFFCTQATPPSASKPAPRLEAARLAYGLVHHIPADYSTPTLGRFDPAWIAQARKRVAAAKESWSAVAGGEMHRLSGLTEQFSLVGDSLKRLFRAGDVLATELQTTILQTQRAGMVPSAPLAMEVATSLLYVDAALEEAAFDAPEEASRVERMAQRIASVRQGHVGEPLEGWMEDLYRRVSDRQTMGSVVQELRASLSEVERLIDQYFRNPTDASVLIPVAPQLSSMRGVLSVLGMGQACAAILGMREDVDELVICQSAGDGAQAHPEQALLFDRLAGNLGALGFLIDMLSVQPQLAKSLFVYDSASGTLSPVMGRSETQQPGALESQGQGTGEGTQAAAGQQGVVAAAVTPRLLEQAQLLAFAAMREDVPTSEVTSELERLTQAAQVADQPLLYTAVHKARSAIAAASDKAEVAAARAHLSDALVDFLATSTEPMGLAELEAANEKTAPSLISRPMVLDMTQDEEMRDIFLDEAREVIAEAQAACAELSQTQSGHTSDDQLTGLTAVRRAFHTLKGSARMVGLKQFGEAAWVCEQAYNTVLAEQQGTDAALLSFTKISLDSLNAWIADIAQGRASHRTATTIQEAAKALRTGTTTAEALLSSPASETADFNAPAFSGRAFDGPDALIATMPMPLAERPEQVSEEISFDLNFDLPDEPRSAPQADVVTTRRIDTDADAADFTLDAPHALDLLPEVHELALSNDASDSIFGIAGIEPFDLNLDSSSEPATSLPDAIPAGAIPADAHAAVSAAMALGPPLEAAPAQPFSAEEEQIKVVGPLRIGIPLFNIYLNEADELSRRLCTELAEWAMELHRPVGESSIALAHSLAGSSATVGFADLSHLARSLENALTRSQTMGYGTREEGVLFVNTADEIRRLLHQFAAGFLHEPAAALMQQLADHEVSSAQRLNNLTAAIDQAGGITAAGVLDTAELANAPEVPHAATPAAAQTVAQTVAQTEAPFLIDEAAEQAAMEADAPVIEADAAEPAGHADFVHTGTGLNTDFGALGVVQITPFVALSAEMINLAGRPDDRAAADEDSDEIDAVDALDDELFVFFEEEGSELLPQLSSRLRDWSHSPHDPSMATSAMRTLHTLKGGARLAGAMRLGEMAHRLENRIEALLGQERPSAADIDALQVHSDSLARVFSRLRTHGGEVPQDRPPQRPPESPAERATTQPHPPTFVHAAAAPESTFAPDALVASSTADADLPPVQPLHTVHAPLVSPEEGASIDDAHDAGASTVDDITETSRQAGVQTALETALENEPLDALKIASKRTSTLLPTAELAPIDWSRFVTRRTAATPKADRSSASKSTVRVRSPLLDRMVNQAGEVSITRSRIEVEVKTLRMSLADLTDNLERLRGQLRDIELQGETQMSSRLEAAKAASQNFDPLEFDRFTRFQELTRMMAESVNDVATVQRTVQRTLEKTEDELAAQARLTRDLQDDLLRTRMVEFEGLSDRLYRVVRQAAKETGKQVRLDIVGGSIEVDRGVLDRMTASFEHLLRNSVTHGIELPEVRTQAGKDAVGSIAVLVTQDGNEVGVEIRDDGVGLDLPRIRDKAVASGLLDAHAPSNDAELTNFIFTSGFSTAEKVTELAGRGVGMDVVRSEVNAIGGRIETSSASGQGTAFKLVLPLTTAVTQVVLLRSGDAVVAVPSTLVEVVRRANDAELEGAYASGSYHFGERVLQFFWLGALLQLHPRSEEQNHRGGQRTQHVVIIRSAQQRIALHVDEVVGNQEVVVKNLGPQLSRVPGLAGMTLLPSGSVALIYNPVALATLFGDAAHAATQAALAGADAGQTLAASGKSVSLAPLILVVDDSLTVRRVTQRLLEREGYRVALAKDGLDAIERLAEERPALVLSDIEMPRMDGFDLVRNIRGDARLSDLPVIMITSRIAQKHRDYAAALGVEHYLGKPYSEEDLLALVAQYTGQAVRPNGAADRMELV